MPTPNRISATIAKGLHFASTGPNTVADVECTRNTPDFLKIQELQKRAEATILSLSAAIHTRISVGGNKTLSGPVAAIQPEEVGSLFASYINEGSKALAMLHDLRNELQALCEVVVQSNWHTDCAHCSSLQKTVSDEVEEAAELLFEMEATALELGLLGGKGTNAMINGEARTIVETTERAMGFAGKVDGHLNRHAV